MFYIFMHYFHTVQTICAIYLSNDIIIQWIEELGDNVWSYFLKLTRIYSKLKKYYISVEILCIIQVNQTQWWIKEHPLTKVHLNIDTFVFNCIFFSILYDGCNGLPQVNQTQWWFQNALLGFGQPKSFQSYDQISIVYWIFQVSIIHLKENTWKNLNAKKMVNNQIISNLQ